MRIKEIALLSILGAVVASVPLINLAGQADAEPLGGKTVVLQKLSYGPSGDVVVDEIGRHTWRPDGSTSYDAVVSVVGKGSTHTRSILDVSALQRADLFFDLGVKLVTPMHPGAAAGLASVTGESCAEIAARTGVQDGTDPYRRRVEKPDGTVSLRVMSPDYYCEVTEAQTYRGSKLIYEVRALSLLDYTDESLFDGGSDLKGVSRTDIAAAHEKHYGLPMFADPSMVSRLHELDARTPSIRD